MAVTVIFKKLAVLAQKLGRERKNCQNPFQAIIKKKWDGPLKVEGKTLVVRPPKKKLFLGSSLMCSKNDRELCNANRAVDTYRHIRDLGFKINKYRKDWL